MSAVPAGGGPRPGEIEDQLKRDGGILHRAGIAMFPVGAGKKPTKAWKKGVRDYTIEHAQPDDLRDWLHDPRTLGWACIAGMLAKVFVFDAEAVGMAYPEILAVFDKTPASAQRTSPSGGKHLYVRLTDAPEDYDWGGFALAKVPVKTAEGKADGHKLLAEVRGHGQYAVVTGPGRPTLSEDFAPVEMTVAEWEALIAPVQALHDPAVDVRVSMAYAKPSSRPLGGKEVIGSGDTADVLRQYVMADMNRWLQILDPGWSITSTDPRRHRMGLQRPSYGAPTEANESGNVQDGVLVVFSESVLWADKGVGTSVGMAFAQAWFAGDFHAAMAAAEDAATLWVEDGIAPDPTGPFAAWPTSLLEEIYTAREALLGATEGLITPAGEPTPTLAVDEDGEPLPPASPFAEAPPESGKPDLRVVDGEGKPLTAADRVMQAKERTRAQKVEEERDRLLAREIAEAMHVAAQAADPARRELALSVTQHRLELSEEARANIRRARQEAMAEGLSAQTMADIFAEPEPEPVWGRGKQVLWAQGQACTLVGSTGVGKSWLTEQLVRAMLGGEPSATTDSGLEVLGFPVKRFDRILYLASDRPTQIKGLMRAFLGDLHVAGRIGTRLVVWPGPVPVSPVGDPKDFVDWLISVGTAHGWGPRDAGVLGEGMALPDVVIFDSLKDFVPDLNQPTDPGLYNQTRQRLVSLGVEVLEMHHTKKGDTAGIDKSFGSSMFANGSGSVLIMQGDPGATEVTLEHAKQPVDTVEAMTLQHDRARFVTRVVSAAAVKALAGPDPMVERCLSYIAVHPGQSMSAIERGLRASGMKVTREVVFKALNTIRAEARAEVVEVGNSVKFTSWDADTDVTEWTQELARDTGKLAIESGIPEHSSAPVVEPEGGLE